MKPLFALGMFTFSTGVLVHVNKTLTAAQNPEEGKIEMTERRKGRSLFVNALTMGSLFGILTGFLVVSVRVGGPRAFANLSKMSMKRKSSPEMERERIRQFLRDFDARYKTKSNLNKHIRTKRNGATLRSELYPHLETLQLEENKHFKKVSGGIAGESISLLINEKQLKSLFRQQAKMWHPDVLSLDKKEYGQRKFNAAVQAFDELVDYCIV
eukprot:g184.t1